METKKWAILESNKAGKWINTVLSRLVTGEFSSHFYFLPLIPVTETFYFFSIISLLLDGRLSMFIDDEFNSSLQFSYTISNISGLQFARRTFGQSVIKRALRYCYHDSINICRRVARVVTCVPWLIKDKTRWIKHLRHTSQNRHCVTKLFSFKRI